MRTEPVERFIGFGRPVLAPAAGTVVRAHATEPDHGAHRGLASIGYMLTQGRRAAGGWPTLAGNHITIETTDGLFVTLCHFQHGSLAVAVADPERAEGVPFAFRGPDGAAFLPRNGEIVG